MNIAERLNDGEETALVNFYIGCSNIALAAKAAGDTLTLEMAKVILATLEAGLNVTANALREANPAAYPAKAQPVAPPVTKDEASVVELDAYRKSGGYLN